MRAVAQRSYGPPEVLQVRDVSRPEPSDDEVLVRVRAASVHADVWHVVRGFPYALRLMGAGLLRPAQPIPGTDLAGTVETVGSGVTTLQPGDDVFGEVLDMQWSNGGTFAEYAVVNAERLVHKPAHLGFEEAAAAPTSGLIALRNLREGIRIHAGDEVLINGAGGSVGTFAVQIAKADGATVTCVDRAIKHDFLRSIGADRVIDYRREDVTRGSRRYHVIFDVASNLTFRDSKRVLTEDGVYVLIGHDHYGNVGRRWMGSMPRFLRLLARARFDRHLPRSTGVTSSRALMLELRDLIDAGKVTPVVDRTFTLERVAEAIHYLSSAERCGSVVVTI